MADSGGFTKEFIEQGFPIEKAKILANFFHVHRRNMGTQQHPDIFKVLCAARFIDERLELETDQSLGAYYANPAQCGL